MLSSPTQTGANTDSDTLDNVLTKEDELMFVYLRSWVSIIQLNVASHGFSNQEELGGS